MKRGRMSRLDEIKKRLESATSGPWTAVNNYADYYHLESKDEQIINEKGICGHEDAALIANIPTDLKYLIARVEKLEKFRAIAEQTVVALEALPTMSTDIILFTQVFASKIQEALAEDDLETTNKGEIK